MGQRPAPHSQRMGEKPPHRGGRQVPLRVEKVGDKTLQSRLIYGNLYVALLLSR